MTVVRTDDPRLPALFGDAAAGRPARASDESAMRPEAPAPASWPVPGAARYAEACLARVMESDGDAAGDVVAFFVPGRVEVLGKHTDYAGGRSLLAAVDRGFYVAARALRRPEVLLTDVRSGGTVSCPLDPGAPPGVGWGVYPTTVARRLARDFPGPLAGARIAFASDLPPAAGMSSSSALITAVFLALAAVNRLHERPAFRDRIETAEELADYVAAIESGRPFRSGAGDDGVGTSGGSEDHVAILCGRPGELVQYAFHPARLERAVPFPGGHVLAIAVSGVRAEKAGAARGHYNRAVELMERAAALWRSATGRRDAVLGPVLDADPDAAGRLRDVLRGEEPALVARVEQFIEESCRIVPAAADALARGDLAAFGELVDRSQHLAETSLGNQVPETVALARSARELGAIAASAFGAGFGGSVWALVEGARADDYLSRWRASYSMRFPERAGDAAFFVTRPGPPARRLAPPTP